VRSRRSRRGRCVAIDQLNQQVVRVTSKGYEGASLCPYRSAIEDVTVAPRDPFFVDPDK